MQATKSDYLLYVSDVHQFNDFIFLGGARPGAGALKAQVTERPKTRENSLLKSSKANTQAKQRILKCEKHIRGGR